MIVSFGRYALCVGFAAALLTGCGGTAPPTAASASRSIAKPLASRSLQVIYSFQSMNDAQLPYSEDAPLLSSGGMLYGTAAGGITGEGCGVNCGTVFSVTPAGDEKLLYSFKGEPDAGNPLGPLITFNGTMYGLAASGGSNGNGAVYTLDSAGNERVIYSFKGGNDGSGPIGPLTPYKGKLYGTTMRGGKDNLGTVFAAEPSGKENVLYSFAYKVHGKADGSGPAAGVTVLNGELYGATTGGGNYAVGTVFGVTTAGKEHVVYSFMYGDDGASPSSPLTAVDGKLYGTTADGGGSNYLGTVFAVTPAGTERVLHRFLESLIDGDDPFSALVYHNNKFYGTTLLGGKRGVGIVFSLTKSGKERVLHSFSGVPDGRYPTGGLTAIDNVFYGTTNEGGTGSSCPYGDGCGTVFAMHP